MTLNPASDNTAIGYKFDISFCGEWVYDMKDHIDVNFMKLFNLNYIFKDYETKGDAEPDYEEKKLAADQAVLNPKIEAAKKTVEGLTGE